jgi:hypothetical protein
MCTLRDTWLNFCAWCDVLMSGGEIISNPVLREGCRP